MKMICVEPKNIYIKDKIDFLANYEKLKEMVFFREVGNAVHVKISCPACEAIAKKILSKIKGNGLIEIIPNYDKV